MEEKLHIATGHGPANAVSLLQVYVSYNLSPSLPVLPLLIC